MVELDQESAREENGGVYTITFNPRVDSNVNPSPQQHQQEGVSVNGACVRIYNNDDAVYQVELETDHDFGDENLLSTKITGEDCNPASVTSLGQIQNLLDRYPLGSRPYFEARKRRRIPKSARSVATIDSGILDDFYLNLVDWGNCNIIALGTSVCVMLLRPQPNETNENDAMIDRMGVFKGSGFDPGAAVETTYVDAPSAAEPTTPNPLHRFSNHGSTAVSEADVTSVKWSPCGQKLASGTRSGVIQIWDMPSGIKVRDVGGHTHRVGALSWIPHEGCSNESNGGNLITSGSRDKLIMHHDLRIEKSVVATVDKHKQEVCGLQWRPPTASIVDVRPSLIRNGPDNHEKEAQGKLDEDINLDSISVETLFQRDLVKASSTRPFTIGDAHREGRVALDMALKQIGDDSIFVDELGHGRPKLASGGNDNKVYIWELGYDTPLSRLTVHTAAVKALAWAPVSMPLLATGGGTNDRTIRLWDINSKKEIAVCETESQVCNLYWSPSTLEVISSHGYTLNQVNVWDVRHSASNASHTAQGLRPLRFRKLATLTGHTARVLYMAGSPDGNRVCTAAGDGSVRVWAAFTDDTAGSNGA